MPSTAHVMPRIHQSLPASSFDSSIRASAQATHLLTALTTPVIFALAIPLALLDLFVTAYQRVCFPVYGIERVRRARYFTLDRHRLPYLSALEKVNCTYCSYANGVLAYAREVTARTESYWCPIKHARPVCVTLMGATTRSRSTATAQAIVARGGRCVEGCRGGGHATDPVVPAVGARCRPSAGFLVAWNLASSCRIRAGSRTVHCSRFRVHCSQVRGSTSSEHGTMNSELLNREHPRQILAK